MISDYRAYGFLIAIRRSCYRPDGQETAVKKMCDEFTERNKKNTETVGIEDK